MKINGKVIFITDADSSSGKAILHLLSGEGAQFILNSASDGAEIQPMLDRCQHLGAKTAVINVDLCSSPEVNAALEQSIRQVGKIDVLIHNNNLVKPVSVETCTEERFFEILNTNAKSAFICTQAVGKRMITRQSGRIIYVSSIHAEKPTGSSFAYSAAKGAVKMLASEAALYLGRHGITVNAIEMGPVAGDDDVFASNISKLYDFYQYKVPNALLGTHDDLAQLVFYLASDQSGFMNGASLRLDGGFLNHYMDHKIKKEFEPGGPL